MNGLKISLSKKEINSFLEILNHKVTKLEVNVVWITRIMWYLAIAITASLIKIMFFGG